MNFKSIHMFVELLVEIKMFSTLCIHLFQNIKHFSKTSCCPTDLSKQTNVLWSVALRLQKCAPDRVLMTNPMIPGDAPTSQPRATHEPPTSHPGATHEPPRATPQCHVDLSVFVFLRDVRDACVWECNSGDPGDIFARRRCSFQQFYQLFEIPHGSLFETNCLSHIVFEINRFLYLFHLSNGVIWVSVMFMFAFCWSMKTK